MKINETRYLHMERVGDDGEDGEGVDEADHDQGVCVVHLQPYINKDVVCCS